MIVFNYTNKFGFKRNLEAILYKKNESGEIQSSDYFIM